MSLEIRIPKEPMLPPGPEPEDREIDGIIYAPYGLPIWWQVDDGEGFEYGCSYAPSRLVALSRGRPGLVGESQEHHLLRLG